MESSYSDGNFYKVNTIINPFLIESLNLLKKGNCCDFGCGRGSNIKFLNKLGWNTYAVEKELCGFNLVKNEIVNCYHSDITKFDFSILPKLDIILCNYVLQHLSISEVFEFLKKSILKLNNGGIFYLSIFEKNNAISYADISTFFQKEKLREIKRKNWQRLDTNHGSVHFHIGVESLWKMEQ